jgi:ubiquinone/menaquinone biosynthesis C-methylase UbiE
MFDVRTQLYDFGVDPNALNTPQAKFIQMIGVKKRVLEVGCASGRFSAYLVRELGCEVVGIEINPEAARGEAAACCSEVIVGDVETDALDKVRGKFDVITFGDVLEHLVAPDLVLARVRGLLDEGGYVLISVPNVAHYTLRLGLLRGNFNYTKYGLMDRTHLRFFTLRTARQMLADSGYRIATFDIVYAVHGLRYVDKCKPLVRFLKRHLTSLVGFQLIFKAVPEPGSRAHASPPSETQGETA